jgi:uncharacterized protein
VIEYFLDSSALIKRYALETGTAWVQSIVLPGSGHRISIAQITQVEVVSGIARRRREGRLSAQAAQAIRAAVDLDISNDYVVIGLSDQIIARAEDLLEAHTLRAYDAVQLATAVELNARFTAAGTAPVIFVSADQRLLAAAVAIGLATDDPNLHT